ncbi:hypothetical protein A2U01_0046598, partial [Trifolium medium]|nr:hypothetical protein [Trifolium medium]
QKEIARNKFHISLSAPMLALQVDMGKKPALVLASDADDCAGY